MGYIGTPIDTRNQFQSLQGKRFNGDGSTTDFTLDIAPGSTLDIEVFVGNVRQDPNSAYTLSGTTLSFTGAPPSGTNNVYVVHQAKSVGTINAPDNSVDSAQLNTALLTGATDIGAAIADADLFLIDDGAGGTLRKTAASRIKTYVDAGDNTPAFFAHADGNQTSLTDNTYTKVSLATEVYDTDSAFADSRFTVPSGEAGKYIIYGSVRPDADSNSDLRNSYLAFYLNGSRYSENRMNYSNSLIRGATNTATLSIDLSAGDYVELYGATDTDGSARSFVGGSSYRSTFMGGYKLII